MPDPNKAAKLVCDWLRSSGFAIVEAEERIDANHAGGFRRP
jgi:hypothetical protein